MVVRRPGLQGDRPPRAVCRSWCRPTGSFQKPGGCTKAWSAISRPARADQWKVRSKTPPVWPGLGGSVGRLGNAGCMLGQTTRKTSVNRAFLIARERRIIHDTLMIAIRGGLGRPRSHTGRGTQMWS